ncbi:type I polyketide synthase [Pelomyxa schiedti]|nr:type I polyketide synthase [Pelomyxa schiedti]
MSCRFPGAPGKEDYWNLLVEGIDAIDGVPASRYPVDLFYDPVPGTPGKLNAKEGGYITNVDLFDNRFFNISKAEATYMDPQHRILLMVTQEAFEDANMVSEKLSGSKTGVFIGICNCDYSALHYHDSNIGSPYAATGNAFSIAANRISYIYNLHGPSMALDTACSSTLVALDVATRYMHQGRCNTAVVGGANLLLSPLPTIALAQSGFLAGDGRCKAFDASGNDLVKSTS